MIYKLTADISELDGSEYAAEFERLDKRARQKAETIKNERAKKCTLAGRILLRRGIGELFGREDYEITYNKNGKPQLDFCYFSISHSGDRVVCVIADTAVGVDIERIREVRRAERYPLFTREETQHINGCENRSEAFLRLWTQKEAYVKMLGGTMPKNGGIDVTQLEKVSFSTEIDENYVISVCRSQ